MYSHSGLLQGSLGEDHTLQPRSVVTAMSNFSHSHDIQVVNPNFTNIDQRASNVHNIHNILTKKNSIHGVHADHVENINLVPSNRAGLHQLLTHSISSATHDSSERHPPPLCYPGTRQDFIDLLTEWGRGTSPDHPERLAWMKGPAGVGKSAIAQSTAQALGYNLGASFFFSRSNHRDDPNRFFTSIAYQLAMKQQAFGDFLDQKIQHDPSIVTKSPPLQFDELIVAPVRALQQQGKALPDMAIFVDGLDECNGEAARQEIVLLVAKSLQDRNTPLRWIFFSRLEPGLVSTFNRPEIQSLTAQFELMVTRELDPQIYHFLASRLKEIREKYDLDISWPPGKDLRTLVEISSGLFACSHAIALYIEDPEGVATPKKQLDVVLGLTSQIKVEGGPKHPLSSLDLFYTFILERLHHERLVDLQMILLATRLRLFPSTIFTKTITYANLLGHSQEDFFIICRSLHAVMKVDSERITFYHVSFMDFLEDPTRSGERCIWSTSPRFLCHIMRSLNGTQLDTNFDPLPSLSWRVSSAPSEHLAQYRNLCYAFLELFLFMVLNKIQDDETCRLVKEFDLRRLVLGGKINTPKQGYNMDKLCHRLKMVGFRGFIRPLWLKNALQVFPKLLRVRNYSSRYFGVGSGKKRIVLALKYNGPWCWSVGFRVYSEGAMEELRKELSSQSGVGADPRTHDSDG
ncbi:hypothetical protein D9756_009768 [Leucocoprinus leucothites]|uniref:Nephrocystin 3-like N-terminal domain-containing protein n=1 Tax=Leucocoprinus leucothites TaxID=201217 RepID=A0A8H5CVH9_9AGAR|nr:hypothetical protein D9756_009768 [Leucoagaricus leucothites]